MTEDQMYIATGYMAKTGSSFTMHLARAWQFADLTNRRRLEEAFQDTFQRYYHEEQKARA